MGDITIFQGPPGKRGPPGSPGKKGEPGCPGKKG